MLQFLDIAFDLLAIVSEADERLDDPRSRHFFSLAAKALLGEIKETRTIISEILDKSPNYAQNASAVLELWLLNPDLARRIDAGLSLAGLDIAALKSSIL